MEFHVLADRVRGEFPEMPGLRLTPAQASRLLGIELSVCQLVIDALVGAAFLRRTPSGTVVRYEGDEGRRSEDRRSYK
jgi:hypothetical protein